MDFYESGPVDILLLRFPGAQFRSETALALRELAVTGQVRVIDLLFVYRTADGQVRSIPLDGLRPDVDAYFAGLDGHLGGGLLDAEDAVEAARALGADASVTVVVIENLWAIPFITTVRDAGGELVDRARLSATAHRRTVADLSGER